MTKRTSLVQKNNRRARRKLKPLEQIPAASLYRSKGEYVRYSKKYEKESTGEI